MKNVTLFALLLSPLCAMAAPPSDLGEVAFRQSLLDLETDLRLMCVAAHPDDEDGATLAFYRMLYGVETHAVIATRGEGGQNEIGPELYNELGVIRTREMKAAAAIEGATLHFLNLPEFGFSKSPEETFAIWDKDVAMERMVRLIREIRPHVIITNHGRMKDHGHHQAIGTVVQEAFDAAADENRFPDQIKKGLGAWQPLRLYIRDFRGQEGAISNNIERLDPLRGMTIAELAASALEVHESQGMKFFIEMLLSTQPRTYYNRIKNHRGEGDILDSRGPLFDGLAWTESGDRPELDSRHVSREEALSVLLPWLATHESFREGSFDEKRRWAAANRAAIQAAELRLRATPGDDLVTPGQKIVIESKIEDFGNRDAILVDLSLNSQTGFGEIGSQRISAPLHKTGLSKNEFAVTIPATAPHTLPLAPRLFSDDFLQPQLSIDAAVNCGDAVLYLSAPVYVDVAPPVAITCPDAPYLVRTTDLKPVPVRLLLSNNSSEALAGYLTLDLPEGWSSDMDRISFSMAKEGEQRFATVNLTPPENLSAGDVSLFARALGATDKEEIVLRVVDVNVPAGVHVGVIESYDNTFVKTLAKLGVSHDTLDIDDYVPEFLDTFSTIIVDIRAYQYRPDLAANNPAMLDYVARGGTLLVMYHKTFDWNSDYAPYPLTLSRNRVTREDADVSVLAPEHPLFNEPNKIGPADWDDWIQERGLYFPSAWHEAYTPLVATSDPGEDIPPGSYLVAAHGKGNYVYTALGWYRQLRELHPGALRCFANMLALQGRLPNTP